MRKNRFQWSGRGNYPVYTPSLSKMAIVNPYLIYTKPENANDPQAIESEYSKVSIK